MQAPLSCFAFGKLPLRKGSREWECESKLASTENRWLRGKTIKSFQPYHPTHRYTHLHRVRTYSQHTPQHCDRSAGNAFSFYTRQSFPWQLEHCGVLSRREPLETSACVIGNTFNFLCKCRCLGASGSAGVISLDSSYGQSEGKLKRVLNNI